MFCYVLLSLSCVGDVWLVLIRLYTYIILGEIIWSSIHIMFMVKINLVCAVKASCSLMFFSLFFGDSAITSLFEIFMSKVHELRY